MDSESSDKSTQPFNSKRQRKTLTLSLLATCLLLFFQNCSRVQFGDDTANNKMSTQLSSINKDNGNDLLGNEGDKTNPPPTETTPQYAETAIGATESIPPLKIFFIVDNSGTMRVNQINLSSAFGSMFDNDNATSLSKFKTDIFIFNTAQKSIDETNGLWAELPKGGLEDITDIATQTPEQIETKYRPATEGVGLLPGDNVGYITKASTSSTGQQNLEFLPASVVGFNNASAHMDFSTYPLGVSQYSNGIHKEANMGVEQLKSDFANRLSILDPNRQIKTLVGTDWSPKFDQIISQESGLCSLARIMRHPDQYIHSDDLATFIIVSDEDDNDPQGLNCVDSITRSSGEERFIDGQCQVPQTKINYTASSSSTPPRCDIIYDSGLKISYKVSSPRTTVTGTKRSYSLNKVDVSYAKVTSYAYDIPRTEIHYPIETETGCFYTDGIKVDGSCSYTYSEKVITVTGLPASTSSESCKDFALTKDSAYILPSHDTTKVPTCVAATPSAGSNSTGCTDALLNCRPVYTTGNITTMDGRFDSALGKTCQQFTIDTLATSGQSLAADVVINNSSYPFSCTNKTVSSTTACDPTSNANCITSDTTLSSITLGIPSSTSSTDCENFAINKKLGFIIDSTHTVSCTRSTDTIFSSTKDYTRFSDAGLAATDVATAGAACPASVESTIRTLIQSRITAGSLVAGSAFNSCTVQSFSRNTSNVQTGTNNVLCSSLSADNIAAPCSSSAGAYRNCRTSDIAGTSSTSEANITVNQAVTCSTACSSTNFCADKSGTVADQYPNCSTVDLGMHTSSTFTHKNSNDSGTICPSGEKINITKGPYIDTSSYVDYVANEETRSTNASISSTALSRYITRRAKEIFKDNTPLVSLFVRQPGDSTGTNGSIGVSYNEFADRISLNGVRALRSSVLADAATYAFSLKEVSGAIRETVDRSMTFAITLAAGQSIRKLQMWQSSSGAASSGGAEAGSADGSWVDVPADQWRASGATVTLAEGFNVSKGNRFKAEYY